MPGEERRKIDEEIATLTAQITQLDSSGTSDPAAAKIVQVKERIRLLRSARNQLAPISRLPPEILVSIFTFSASCAGCNTSTRRQSTTPASVVISWVSEHWRDLAVGCTELWRTITFLNEDLVHRYASRAQGQPLTIYTHGLRTTTLSHKIGGLLHILPQTQDLHISGNTTISGSYHNFNVYPSLEWEIPAPVLTHLFLENVNLPDNTFTGTCPALQSVCLISCRFSWHRMMSTLPTGIKKLHIQHPEPVGPPEAVHYLARFQDLEDLALFSVFSLYHTETQIDLRPHIRVQLPKLRSFSLRQNSWTATLDFLQRIGLPNEMGVLDVSCWFKSGDAFVPMNNILKGSCDLSHWRPSSLVISRSESVVGCVLGHGLTPGLGGRATFEQAFYGQAPRRLPTFSTFFNSLRPLGISHIESLGFEGKFPSTLDEPIHIPFQFFGSISSIHSLTISSSYYEAFMRFLGEDILRLSSGTRSSLTLRVVSTELPATQILFPNLRDLTIESPDESLGHLVDWVRARRQVGHGIATIRFVTSRPRPSVRVLEPLRGLVDNVLDNVIR